MKNHWFSGLIFIACGQAMAADVTLQSRSGSRQWGDRR